jgi:hypothetical protein
MSSVLRGFAQTRARTLHVVHGTYLITHADLMTWAAQKNAVVSGSMITLDMGDIAFGEAMFDLFDDYEYSVDSDSSVLDLGKKVYIGMPDGTGSELAGESQIFTFNLVKLLQGTNRDLVGYVLTALNANQTIIDQDDEEYFDVEVSAGAA